MKNVCIFCKKTGEKFLRIFSVVCCCSFSLSFDWSFLWRILLSLHFCLLSLFSSVSLSKSNTSFRFEGFTSPSSLSRLRENVFPPKQPLLPFKMNVLTRFLRPSSLSCPSSPPPEFHTSLDSFLFLPLLQPPVSFSSCLQGLYGLYVNLDKSCVFTVFRCRDETRWATQISTWIRKKGRRGNRKQSSGLHAIHVYLFRQTPSSFSLGFSYPCWWDSDSELKSFLLTSLEERESCVKDLNDIKALNLVVVDCDFDSPFLSH